MVTLLQSMRLDITSSLKTLAKGALLTSSCLLFHGCATWSPFEKKQKPEVTPESTLVETQAVKDQELSEETSAISEEKLREEQTTKIEKQHLRALPRRPVVEEEPVVIELSDEDVEEQHSDEIIMYTVQKGDVLSRIARKFHTTVDAIIAENHLKNKNRVFAGQVLAIPSNGITAPTKTEQETENGCYVVQKGDTLSGIAKHFNTSIDELRKNNRLHNDVIYVGQKLRLTTPEAVTSNNELPKIETEKYVVQSGDVLWNIARRCGMSVKELMQINHITNPKSLRVGQVLYVKAQPEVAEPPAETFSEKTTESATPSTVLDSLTQEDLPVEEKAATSGSDLEDNFEDLFEDGNDIPVIPLDEVK